MIRLLSEMNADRQLCHGPFVLTITLSDFDLVVSDFRDLSNWEMTGVFSSSTPLSLLLKSILHVSLRFLVDIVVLS